MLKILKNTILIFLLSQSIYTFSQADFGMSTSLYNRASYNPAFIARTDYFYIFSNTRQQWIGFEGAPKVYYLQASEYVHNLRSAFGISMMNDQIGSSSAINPLATYAYRIQSKNGHILSFGMSGGAFSRTINGGVYDADVVNDPTIDYSIENVTHPDANAGMEFQTSRFILGLSSTHLFSINKSENDFHNTNHRYGYLIYKNNSFKNFYFKVGVQVVNRNNVTIYEGNTLIRLKHGTGLMNGPKEIFDFGLAYRSSRQLALILGLLLTPDIRVAYAYDQSFIESYYQNTTHEIMVAYRLFNKAASTRLCGRK